MVVVEEPMMTVVAVRMRVRRLMGAVIVPLPKGMKTNTSMVLVTLKGYFHRVMPEVVVVVGGELRKVPKRE